MSTTLRIVAVADTHLYQDDLKDKWSPGDVFVHAGDFLQAGTLEELASVIGWLDGLPYKHKIIVAGNHDVCFESSPIQARAMLPPDIHYLQDDGVEIEGVQFWGSPWQPRIHDWAFGLDSEEALAQYWSRIPSETDVLITHTPAQGIGDRVDRVGHVGSSALNVHLKRVAPALHCFGHVHHQGGIWHIDQTIHANVTTWESERLPTIFDLEIESKSVTPIYVPARDPYEDK